jgi:hypothetical protein
MLLRDNPFDIKNRSFAVGSETTYTQEWGGGGVWCRLRIKPQRLAVDSAYGLEARQNAVSELHTLDQFWQLVVAVDPAMTGSGSGKR